MMWRFRLLLVVVLGWTTFAGCQGDSQPKPLTAEQERELQEQAKQVQDAERAHFTEQTPGADKGQR